MYVYFNKTICTFVEIFILLFLYVFSVKITIWKVSVHIRALDYSYIISYKTK